ncbi:MAG: hypothetical protein ACFFCW_30025 [Candidatus Hodarchaeota archaeon]
MAEEVSPESKLYVKEEIEKSRKEFKEDLEKAQSRATKTFATIGMIVGLLAGVGVWSSTIIYVKDRMSNTTIAKLESDATDKHDNIVKYEKAANKIWENLSKRQKIAHLPIGTILQSMLAPDEFAVAVGDPNIFDASESGWVLADGQKDITNSRYGQLSGKTTPPDLRGVFLRGMNVNGGQDPDNNRAAGSYQGDALQQHHHWTDAFKLPPSWTGRRDTDPLGYTKTGDADALPASVTNVKDARTADETRPKNVAVYFYIKIN